MSRYVRKSAVHTAQKENGKLYDLGSGYLGEMPIAKVKLSETDEWRPVYSAECLLIDIEKEGEDFKVSPIDRQRAEYADTHREDLIL